MVGVVCLIVDPALAKRKFERDLLLLLMDQKKLVNLGISMQTINFPLIDVGFWWRAKNREIILRIQADDYDYLPVQGWWIDKEGSPLRQGRGLVPNGAGFQVQNSHPYNLDRGWLCFPGWREYHDHQSHQNLSWASIRHNPSYRLPGLILQLFTNLNRQGVSAQ